MGIADRSALGVLTQYRMAAAAHMHRLIAPGLLDRILLPQAGPMRAWFATLYGVQLSPELYGRWPSRTVRDPTAVRLKVGHTRR